MSEQWYFVGEGLKHGPFSTAQLKQVAAAGMLHSDDQVQKAGMQKWVPASSVKGLFTGTTAPPASVKKASKPDGGEFNDADEPDDKPNPKKQHAASGKGLVIVGAAGGGVLLLALLVVVAMVVFRGRTPTRNESDERTAQKGIPIRDARHAAGGKDKTVRHSPLPSDPGDKPPPGDDKPQPEKKEPTPDKKDDSSDSDIPLPSFDKAASKLEMPDFAKLDYTKGPKGDPLFPVQGVDVNEKLVGADGPVPNGKWQATAFRDVRGVWKHGVETHWNLKGVKWKELHWFNGKQHGAVKIWHENGQLGAEEFFKDGKAHGVSVAWHPNGKKAVERTFDNGVQTGCYAQWDEKGNKKVEATFKDGKQDGPAVTYYPTGQRREQATFRDGKQVGAVYRWHPNGKLESRLTLRDGKKVGKEVTWDASGRLALEVDWDADITKPAPPITKGKYDHLKVGMTREQVMRVLGGKWSKTVRSDTFKKSEGKFGYSVIGRDTVRYEGQGGGYALFRFEGSISVASTRIPLVDKQEFGLK